MAVFDSKYGLDLNGWAQQLTLEPLLSGNALLGSVPSFLLIHFFLLVMVVVLLMVFLKKIRKYILKGKKSREIHRE